MKDPLLLAAANRKAMRFTSLKLDSLRDLLLEELRELSITSWLATGRLEASPVVSVRLR